MSFFRRNKTLTQKGSVTYNAIDEFVRAENGTGGDGEGVVYLDKKDEAILSGGYYTNSSGMLFALGADENLLKGGIEDGDVFLMDIAQAHHFSVVIEGFPTYTAPEGTMTGSDGQFLPAKSINFNYTSYENMSIPLAIFGDFPLLNKKRVSTISLSCYDSDSNTLEYALKKWEHLCFPKGRYVAYMDEIARKFDYRGYGVDGRETFRCSFYVIPTGNVSVSRDYSANDAKLVNFSVVCVGDGSTCATGPGRSIQWANKVFENPITEKSNTFTQYTV